MSNNFKKIVDNLKKKVFAQVYFLSGEEPWFADFITDYIATHALKEEEKAFNQTILYGRDTNPMDIVHAARRYPMMAPRQVVIIKEAQHLKNFEPLVSYLKAPAPATILVINYRDNFDKRPKDKKAFYKELTQKKNENFVTLETKKLYDSQIGDWINDYLKSMGLTIEASATQILVDHLGTDLSKIVNALDKLKIAIGPQIKNITPEHVDKYIGISKDFNNFELQKAIINGNVVKAYQIARIFGKNPQKYPLTFTIATLFAFFRKLLTYHVTKDKSQHNLASVLKVNPFFVKDYHNAARRFNWAKTRRVISLLREYDLRSKGVNNNSASDGELLQEMIFKIMH